MNIKFPAQWHFAMPATLVLLLLGTASAQTPAPANPATEPVAEARQLQQIEPQKALPAKAKRWALVIGVDKYNDPQISPLRGAANTRHQCAKAVKAREIFQ